MGFLLERIAKVTGIDGLVDAGRDIAELGQRLGLVERVERSGDIVERAESLGGHANERFIFLVDTSYSMGNDISEKFSSIHGDFLDALSDGRPESSTTLVTFDEGVHVQYSDLPIAAAPSLKMVLTGSTDFPNAIMTGIGVERLARGDTVIIVTDGDVTQCHGKYDAEDAKRGISQAIRRGTRFLFLLAGSSIGEARSDAAKVGITNPGDVRIWKHSAEGIRKTFAEVADDLLLLGKQ